MRIIIAIINSTEEFSDFKNRIIEQKFLWKESVKRVQISFFAPIFWGQTSQGCASIFACFGAIIWTTQRESVWWRTAEPDRITSDIGAKLQSDSFNRGRYIVSSGWIWVEKPSFFFRQTATITVLTFPLEMIYHSGQKKAGKCRASERRAKPAGSGDQKSNNPESRKSRNPRVQRHVMSQWANEPVSQWILSHWASALVPVSQWVSEPLSADQITVVKWTFHT